MLRVGTICGVRLEDGRHMLANLVLRIHIRVRAEPFHKLATSGELQGEVMYALVATLDGLSSARSGAASGRTSVTR